MRARLRRWRVHQFRLRAAWNVLCGRPTIYGVRDTQAIRMDLDLNRGAVIACCTVDPELKP